MRRTLLSLTAALVGMAAAVPTADAEVRHVIRGAGFGHGIGMSQYGAYGFALEGSSYANILAHYYKGTQLGSAPSRPVRVLLQPDDPYIRVRGATSIGGRELNANTLYVAREVGSGIRVTTSGGRRVAKVGNGADFRGPGALRLMGPALNSISDGLYRGAIELRTEGAGVTAINELDIDTYVRGVVAGESARSDAAVAQTAGRVLTYGGQPAVTYYFSTSGGHTENVEFSFVGSLSKPWLVGVPDPYDSQSPYPRWKGPSTAARLDSALGAPGRFKRVKVLDRGVSPRVIRARLGLRDTWFTFVRARTSVSRARSARPASWGPRLVPPALVGRYTPAPKGRVLIVERRAKRGWQRVGKVRTTKAGRYRMDIGRAGAYRVRSGRVAGPTVRVR